jgi:WD40 repeat protein
MTGLAFGWLDGLFEEEPVMAFSPDSQLLATAVYEGPFRGEDKPKVIVTVWRFEAEDYEDEEYEFCVDKAYPSGYDGEKCISGRGEAGWAYFGDENSDLVGSVTDMTFSPDGQYLAVTVQEDTDVPYLLDVGDESLHMLWKSETSLTTLALTSLTSSCGGFVAAGREDGKIIFQAVDEGVNGSREPLTHPGPVEALIFSPDCRRLASMGGGVIVLWDLTAVDVPMPFELRIDTWPGDFASFTEWDYSGVVSGSECIRTETQLDPDSHCVQSAIEGGFAGFTGIVTALAKSPDGRTLAAGIFNGFDRGEQPWPEECYRGEVWLWPGGPKSALYLGYQECVVTELIFSPDGKVLASVDQDGAVVFWDVDFESLIARACYKANRNLTEDEWRTFMGPDRPYRVTCPSLEGPDPSRLDAALKQIEPLLPAPAPTRTPTPTAAPRNPSGDGG